MRWREYLAQATQILAAAGVLDPAAEARYLWEYASKFSYSEWLTHEWEPSPQILVAFDRMVQRRARREPFHYIVGSREFMGLTLSVNQSVLVPRPETEILVQRVLEHLKCTPGAVVVDVGTGSGAIALAIRRWGPQSLEVLATEVSESALAVARENGRRLQLLVSWRLGSLLQPISDPVDVVVANLPYIADSEEGHLAPELSYEPSVALYGGAKGTELVEQLIDQSRARLRPGGHIYLELGQGQSQSVMAYLTDQGFAVDPVTHDYAGINRVVGGRWEG